MNFLPACRNHFFTHATNRQHMPGQGQLAGHGDAFFGRLIASQGQQGAGHCHASAGAVFGRGPFWHMQMHKGFIEELGIAAELLKVGADVAVSNFS